MTNPLDYTIADPDAMRYALMNDSAYKGGGRVQRLGGGGKPDEDLFALKPQPKPAIPTVRELVAEIGKNPARYEAKYPPKDATPIQMQAYRLMQAARTTPDAGRYLESLNPYFDSQLRFDIGAGSDAGYVKFKEPNVAVMQQLQDVKNTIPHELTHTLQLGKGANVDLERDRQVMQRAQALPATMQQSVLPSKNKFDDMNEVWANINARAHEVNAAGGDFINSPEGRALFPTPQAQREYYTKSMPGVNSLTPSTGTFVPNKAEGGLAVKPDPYFIKGEKPFAEFRREIGMKHGGAQRFDEGGQATQDQMRYELERSRSPVIEATPQSTAQRAIGTVGGYLDKAGRFISGALEPIAESHPVRRALVDMLLADPLKNAGTALQDYTKTGREITEDRPYVRAPLTGSGQTLRLDPRVLDIAGVAQPVVSGVTKLAGAGAKAAAPFARSTAEMANELYATGQMPGMVAPNAYMAEPSAPKPTRALAPANEQGFYSPTEAAALNLQRKTGNGQAFLNDLLKQENVRPDEIEAMGLDTWLKGKKDVTAAEVQDYIAQNKLKLGESVYGGKAKGNFLEFLKEKGYPDDEALRILNKAEDGNMDNQVSALRDEYLDSDVKPTKFKEYSLPGGENYREVVLTLPLENKDALEAAKIKAGDARKQTAELSVQYRNQKEIDPQSPRVLEAWQKLEESRNLRDQAEAEADALRRVASEKTYRSSHFDEPNPIAHLRMSDRVTDGKKTLLVDEVQSDWHQAGREQGYAQPETARLKGKVVPDESGTYKVVWEDGTFSGGYSAEGAAAKAAEGKSNAKQGVPDAPFKDDWYQLALKRAIKEAIDGGYDRVALPTGSRVNERFNLSKYIESISHQKNPDGTYKVVALDKKGSIALNNPSVPQDKLSSIVGKDVAQKIIDAEGKVYPKGSISEGMRKLSGLELEVGGEGNKKYYDEVYPGYLKKFGKKYGATVGTTGVEVPPDSKAAYQKLRQYEGSQEYINGRTTWSEFLAQHPEAAKDFTEPLHYMDITPAMREAFKTGIHMKKGGKVSFANSLDAMRHELTKAK